MTRTALTDTGAVRRRGLGRTPLMATGPDLSPDTVPLDTVFHLD